MDWADDAAYSLNDIVDGVKAGFLTIDRIEAWADGKVGDAMGVRLLDELLDGIRRDRLEGIFSRSDRVVHHRLPPEGARQLHVAKDQPVPLRAGRRPRGARQALFYKTMANDIIFESPQLQQMEHKARKVLFDLWDCCWSNYVETGLGSCASCPRRWES